MTDTPGSARIPASALTASDRAYAYVKERILSGELEGGALISEGEIAEALRMSRTPVREAFLRLQTEGWMKLYPKRGASITPIKPRESDDVIEARALLETHAVSTLAAERAGELAGRLQAIIGRQLEAAQSDDLTGFATADADFHAAIAASGGNELLTDFYLGLRDRQRRMTQDSVQRSPDARDRILDQHRRLVELIAAGDAEAFGAEISKHLDDIHRR